MTEISAGSIHRELKAMSEAGLLLRTPVGNQVHYQANQASPIFNELAAIFRKTIGLASLLHDSLIHLAGGVDWAFVFGSMPCICQPLFLQKFRNSPVPQP
jgi:hypothetical protein